MQDDVNSYDILIGNKSNDSINMININDPQHDASGEQNQQRLSYIMSPDGNSKKAK